MEKIIWHRFVSRLVNYIEEEAYKNEDFGAIIDILSESDTSDENNWRFKILDAKNTSSLPDYIKPIIKKFLPIFFMDFPDYKNSEILNSIDK